MQDPLTIWEADLQLIWTQVVHIGHLDDVYWQVAAIARSNQVVIKTTVFPDWMTFCFVDALAAGLRRLVDTTPRTVSLVRLLQDMENSCTALTRQRYIALFDGHPSELLKAHASETFDSIAGKGAKWVPVDRIRGRRVALIQACVPIIDYANTYVAHLSNKVRPSPEGAPKPPTFRDARRALLAVFEAFRWCSLVICADDHISPVPTIQENWLACFRTPWLTADADAPPYERLDEFAAKESKAREGTV